MYTFENVCLEDRNLRLGDEAIKVIINPDSDRTGLSEEMNSFLDLLVGKKATKGVAKEIAAVIASARKDKLSKAEAAAEAGLTEDEFEIYLKTDNK